MRIEPEQPAKRDVDGDADDAPEQHASSVQGAARHQSVELSDTKKDDARGERVKLA